ncbi:MAG TPA: hypothetical protein VIM38_11875 [Alphaproteobacteria bacterium]
MPIGQLIAFAVWLALAMAGGVLIVFVWERLRASYCDERPATRAQPKPVDGQGA